MNLINLWLISHAIGIILFDNIYIGYYIKKLFKVNPAKFVKPWDCRFCMTHHIALITGVLYLFITKGADIDILYYLFINFSLTTITNKLWGE